MAFAVVEAVNVLSVATFESLSVMWTELLMFVVAGILYYTFSAASPVGARAKKDVHCGRETIVSKTSAKGSLGGSAGLYVLAPSNDSKPIYIASDSKQLSAEASSDLPRQVAMIKAHARERDLKGAQMVFDRLKSSGVASSPVIFNCMLDAFTHCGDHEGAIQHFDEMKRLNFVDVVGFNTMLKAYLGRGFSKEAHDLVHEMSARGLHPNKVTFNELLHSKVMAKDRRGIWSIIEGMHAAGLKANPITCSILLKSLTETSDAADIRRIVSLIDEVEDPIDEVLFSSVIEACIRVSQLDLLSDLMRRFQRMDSFVSLSAPTYGSMIKAYGQAGDIARVRELWAEMDERVVRPTAITLGCMIEALVVNHQPDEAWALVHQELESEERRGNINTIIYSTVLKGFALAKRFDKVYAVYKEMRSKEVPCNTITYNTMLDACAKCWSMNRASELLQDMKASSVAPDIITYSTIIKGYCAEGDVDTAFHVLEEMKSDGKFVPDEIMYNSILDGCAKQRRVDAALKLLDEMKAAGVGQSNYTLSILVKLLGHARRLGQAFTIVDELSKQNGFRPNVQVYTCLVQACVLNRRLEKAFELYTTMVEDASCRVDGKFYAVLAKGCIQMHQPMKAIQVIRAAYQLPGHGLVDPAKKPLRPIGIDAAALDEVAAKLQSGSQRERDALTELIVELKERFGVQLGVGRSSGGGNRSGNEAHRGGQSGRSRGRGVLH